MTQSCPTLCSPMDCSPPGFLVNGISQERVANGEKFHIVDPSDPRIKPTSLASPALVGGFFTTSATWETPMCSY